MKAIDYRIFSIATGEQENSTEAHVLARAYRAAWRATHGDHPVGCHEIPELHIVIEFCANGDRKKAGLRRSESPVSAPASGAGKPKATAGAVEGTVPRALWSWLCRVFSLRSPSRELERALGGWGIYDSSGRARTAYGRERLDLMRGWVPEDPERAYGSMKARQGDSRERHPWN